MVKVGNLVVGTRFWLDGQGFTLVGKDACAAKVQHPNGKSDYWSLGTEVTLSAPRMSEVVVATNDMARVLLGGEKHREVLVTKSEAPAKEPKPKQRYNLLGHPVTAVLRWMGKQGWTFDRARKVLVKNDLAVADATVKIQLKAGAKGERGEPAALTGKDIKALEKWGGK